MRLCGFTIRRKIKKSPANLREISLKSFLLFIISGKCQKMPYQRAKHEPIRTVFNPSAMILRNQQTRLHHIAYIARGGAEMQLKLFCHFTGGHGSVHYGLKHTHARGIAEHPHHYLIVFRNSVLHRIADRNADTEMPTKNMLLITPLARTVKRIDVTQAKLAALHGFRNIQYTLA